MVSLVVAAGNCSMNTSIPSLVSFSVLCLLLLGSASVVLFTRKPGDPSAHLLPLSGKWKWLCWFLSKRLSFICPWWRISAHLTSSEFEGIKSKRESEIGIRIGLWIMDLLLTFIIQAIACFQERPDRRCDFGVATSNRWLLFLSHDYDYKSIKRLCSMLSHK